MGKTVSGFLKEEIKEAAGPLQVCAGHNAGAEAAIHAMSQVFVEEGTDGILLIDASNAFNQMNRSAALHNIQINIQINIQTTQLEEGVLCSCITGTSN